ncbi:hypothetical protein BDF19DRAFT_450065 [Syncephalis fuscata]|nr:hypothetical protein BDF19DRAFT_450065 [Syncephalis fuscata]
MVFNGLIEAIHTDAKTGKQTIRHIPYQTTRGAQRVLGPLRRDDNYPRLDYMDANGNLFTSTSKTRLVTAAGDYVAVRFRLDTPSPWALVAVEDLNGNIIGMAYDANGGPLDATKDDPNDDTWCYWNGLIQPMPSFNQPGTSITPVQDGQYKLRLFTYRPYSPDGSLNVRSSYDTWLSPVVTVTGIAALYGASAQSQGISTQTTGKSTSVMTKLSVTGADMRIQSGTMQLMYKITQ